MRDLLLKRAVAPLMTVVAFAFCTHGCAPSGPLQRLAEGTRGEQYRVLTEEDWSLEIYKLPPLDLSGRLDRISST